MENLIGIMGWGARLVLVFLFGLSVWSVSIMIDRRRAFKNTLSDPALDEARALINKKDWNGLRSWAESHKTIFGGAVLAALDVPTKNSESVDRAFMAYIVEERIKLEKGLTVLATLGNNAPFIGLFGTVLGIIQSFGILSNNAGSAMNAVMLGLAEALIATAVGLFVAMPASTAYNYFSQKLRESIQECGSIRDLFISRI